MEPNRHNGSARPSALDSAAANTDLWTVYLRAQTRSWLDPFGLATPETVDAVARPIAEATAAVMSGWLSLLTAPTIRAMYEANKPAVSQFVHEQAIDADNIEIPPDYTLPPHREPAHTQTEEWALTSPRREPVLVG